MQTHPHESTSPLVLLAPEQAEFRAPPAWRNIFAMNRLRNPWTIGVACVAFILMVLATATRVSPPTPLHGIRTESGTASRFEPSFTPTAANYAWLSRRQANEYVPLCDRISPPDGYSRVYAPPKSFANWLRHLPVAPADTPVKTGRRKVVIPADSPSIAAVITLQPTSDRLLAGANMLIRLRAEFAWGVKQTDQLGFHFTSGHFSTWSRWAEGERPFVEGRKVHFKKSFEMDQSRANFCSWLETVFQYSTHYSVLEDSRQVGDGSIAVGDIFLNAKKKGYALIVLDAAAADSGSLRVLLGEAGTPAQTFHVLRGADGSPWFTIAQDEDIEISGGRTVRLRDLRRLN